MNDERPTASAARWRKQSRSNPLPRDQAVRQGSITSLAHAMLGRHNAMAFLNTDNPLLGGRPIALATESRAGQLSVEAELGRMRERQVDALDGTRSTD